MQALCGSDLLNVTVYADLTENTLWRSLLVLLFASVQLLTFVGNAAVIVVICSNPFMRTVTNTYIINLSVTDALVAVAVMPWKAYELLAPCEWNVFTDLGCQVTQYLFMVFVFTNLMTLMIISIERYFAIVYPLHAHFLQCRKKTRLLILLCWLLPILLLIPSSFQHVEAIAFIHPHHEADMNRPTGELPASQMEWLKWINTRRYCSDSLSERSRMVYFITVMLVFYVVPLATISYTSVRIILALLRPVSHQQQQQQQFSSGRQNSCYAFQQIAAAQQQPLGEKLFKKNARRSSVPASLTVPNRTTAQLRLTSVHRAEESKRKVARMIVLIAFLYFLSWTPFYATNFVALYQNFYAEGQFFFVFLCLHLFGCLNSLCNPLIYYLMSERLRGGFQALAAAVFQCNCTRFRAWRLGDVLLDNGQELMMDQRRRSTVASLTLHTQARMSNGGGGSHYNMMLLRSSGHSNRRSPITIQPPLPPPSSGSRSEMKMMLPQEEMLGPLTTI